MAPGPFQFVSPGIIAPGAGIAATRGPTATTVSNTYEARFYQNARTPTKSLAQAVTITNSLDIIKNPTICKTGWSVASVYLDDRDKKELQHYCGLRRREHKRYSMGGYFRELLHRDRRRRCALLAARQAGRTSE